MALMKLALSRIRKIVLLVYVSLLAMVTIRLYPVVGQAHGGGGGGGGPVSQPVAHPSPTFFPTATPTTMTAATFTAQKGVVSGKLLSQNQAYSYIVSPSGASTIQIVFTTFFVIQATLTIRDGNNEFSPVLFSCASCGILVR